MESIDPGHYLVALILPLKEDYEIAVKLLDNLFVQRSLHSSGTEYTLGRAGPHHLVLAAGLDNASAAELVATVVPDLLKEYPFIRAGFLVGVGAMAPRGGLAQAGNIVVGMPQGYESGLVQFDAERSWRLHVMGHWRKPPLFMNRAVDDTLSPQGRHEWRAYFDKHLSAMMASSNEPIDANTAGNVDFSTEATHAPDPSPWFNLTQGAPVVLKGRVGSSSKSVSDSELLQRLASDSGILCFETAAAGLQERLPLVVVCGISQRDPSPHQQENDSKHASAYAMFLARHRKSSELAKAARVGYIFIHRPLSLEGSSFRLLQLHRGIGSPIQCSMFEAYLNDAENLIEYEALSYAWGDSQGGEIINVDGQVLQITRSLHGALQHLRGGNKDRILWADAICIDQTNIMERGHQVAQMGTIYSLARNAIVWLGSVSESATSLLSALGSLQKKVALRRFDQWQPRDDRWKQAWEELHGRDTSGGQFHHQLIDGLEELTRKSWFSRVWILQEVAKATSAQIHCSSGTISAKFLALAPWLLGYDISQQPQAVLDIFPGPSRQWSWWAERRTLWDLPRRFQNCQATDPRDRVYALLGIASDMAEGAIQPDYSRSEHQVLRDTCNYLFGEERFDELSGPQGIKDLQQDLPKWAEVF